MGRRSDFARRRADKYLTPREAVPPLIPHLPGRFDYAEPCAGDGRLIRHLAPAGRCRLAWDIEPQAEGIQRQNAVELTRARMLRAGACWIITNPPWTRSILHRLIELFSEIAPTWLLFDAAWLHTEQAVPYLERCDLVVSTPRLKWIDGSDDTAKDDACWYRFGPPVPGRRPVCMGRSA